MTAAYWGLLLMSFHAGSHGAVMLAKLESKTVKTVVSGVIVLASVYGVYAFIKRRLLNYLFCRVQFMFFNYSESFVLYYLDYLSVIILFMTLGFLITKTIKK